MVPLQCATLFNNDGYAMMDPRQNPVIVDDGEELPGTAAIGFDWYDPDVNIHHFFWSIRSVSVRRGCTLEVFENEGFTGRSGAYSTPANGPAGQFELNETPNNMNTIRIKSLKCHCPGMFCYSQTFCL